MPVLVLEEPECCAGCNKEASDEVRLLKCSKCHCAHYCGKQCQQTDWPTHRKCCKRMLFIPKSELPAFDASSRKVDTASSEVYQTALAAAHGQLQRDYLHSAELAANQLAKCCVDDILPMAEAEGIWGLRGDTKSTDYTKLYATYQHAMRYGDLTATKLFECLLARPHASQALTQALQSVKMVKCERDAYATTARMVDIYRSKADGLVVVSDVDQWHVPSDHGQEQHNT